MRVVTVRVSCHTDVVAMRASPVCHAMCVMVLMYVMHVMHVLLLMSVQ